MLWVLAFIALWFAGLALLAETGLPDFLDHRIVRPLEFRVRLMLGRSPALDPHLVVFALDDSTAAKLGGLTIPTADWVEILNKLASKNPRAILVDKLFTADRDVTVDQGLQLKGLGRLPVPIAVGALLAPSAIKYRSEIPNTYFASDQDDNGSFQPIWQDEHDNRRLGGADFKGFSGFLGRIAYGPAPLFRQAFRQIGHVMQPWPVRFAPAISLGSGINIPHLALFAAKERRLIGNELWLDHKWVPRNDEGLAPINFVPPNAFAARIKPLRTLLSQIAKGGPITSVNADDVVVIINDFSTGNTDILDSPFGPIPGGYIVLSVVNSVLRGDWLREVPHGWLIVLAFCIAGAFMGHLCSNLQFWSGLLFFMATYLGSALLSFAFTGYLLPWLFPFVGLLGSGLSVYTRERFQETKRRLHLEMEYATAASLQQQFFPDPAQDFPTLSLRSYYHPADAVGGDWYAYYLVGAEWLHIHLGDVTGHGTSAALLASFAKGAADMTYEQQRHDLLSDPAALLSKLHGHINSLLSRCREGHGLMTMISVAINLTTGDCYCLNSGHRPAIVVSPDLTTRKILTRHHSSILGFQETEKAAVPRYVKLQGDECILLYSDGLQELVRPSGQFVSEKYLVDTLRRLVHMEMPAIRSGLLSTLMLPEKEEPLAKSRGYKDDVTFVLVKLRIPKQVPLAG